MTAAHYVQRIGTRASLNREAFVLYKARTLGRNIGTL
jgi:hypothetical protein